MLDWIINEWTERGLGVLIVGGQAMIAKGLRQETKDLDSCLSARQCPRMLAWLEEKEREGRSVEIRLGSAPLHPDWLARGWTFHVLIDHTDKLDFFGIPLRAPSRIASRFFQDPADIALASMTEMGDLKRTQRAQDWADIDLIVARLREMGDADAMMLHLFGDALVEEMQARKTSEQFRRAMENSQQAELRPILRLGLIASLNELREMARAEKRFWEVVGASRSDEIKDTQRRFWRKNHSMIKSGTTFAISHQLLLMAARTDLPLSPIKDPAQLIEAARGESAANRWPDLLPPMDKLVSYYFPEYRPELGAQWCRGFDPPIISQDHEPEP